MSAITREVYDRYQRIYRAHTEWYRKRLVAADPRLPLDQAFHLAHNWGNEAARALLDRYQRMSHAIYRRGSREYRRVEHKTEHGRDFRPLWCKHCRAESLTVKAAQAQLRALGLVLRRVDGEFRVNYRNGAEGTAYYTDDIVDAVATGCLMAKERAAHALHDPEARG